MIHDVEQKSAEWHELRIGKITGSNFYKILGSGLVRESYLHDKAAEIITKRRADSDSFSNAHIQRGNLYEKVAINEYEVMNFTSVKQIGFVTLKDYAACSPDGFVGQDGMIEVKIPDSNRYLKYVLDIKNKGERGIRKDYYLQMQFNMYVRNKKWCDFVLYNEKYDINESKGLYIKRVYKNEKEQSMIQLETERASKEINILVNNYQQLITF